MFLCAKCALWGEALGALPFVFCVLMLRALLPDEGDKFFAGLGLIESVARIGTEDFFFAEDAHDVYAKHEG